MLLNHTPTTNPLDIIASEAAAAAASFGITCQADIAKALVERIVKRMGGQQIYIPSQTASQSRLRSIQIQAQFTGNNIKELASVHNITPRQVRRITDKKTKIIQAPAQKNSDCQK